MAQSLNIFPFRLCHKLVVCVSPAVARTGRLCEEEERGRSGDIAEKLMRSCEETCAVLLQAMVPVMKVTYDPCLEQKHQTRAYVKFLIPKCVAKGSRY